MDPAQFDALTRSAANRRDVLTRLGAGGLAAGVLATFGWRRQASARVACSLDLRAFVRLGPSAGIPLTPAATQAGNIAGTLQLTIGGDGSIANAAFVLADGTSLTVVGQAIGHQLAVRLALDEQHTLVLQGVAEQPLSICQGAVDGSVIGPSEGDLGDFHATATGAITGSLTGGTTPAVSEEPAAGPAPTEAPTEAPSMPTPNPTPECVPLTAAELCSSGACGFYSDGCGGSVECPSCPEGEVCLVSNSMCCKPQTADEFCAPEQCDEWTEPCGFPVNCGACDAGLLCQAGICCSPPGAQCFVGGECCSGSCSMLNGCN